MPHKLLACTVGLFLVVWLPHTPAHAESAGVAVVELFTSQGCSSCPPADRVLAELDAQARRDNQPVFILSYHVDYWNRLGWTDPFSSPEASQRQQQYARVLRTKRIYTPQMIVNGRRQFLGSNAATAREAVADALSTPATVEVVLDAPRINDNQVTVNITLPDDTTIRQALLLVVLTQHGLVTEVQRGENHDRTLTHEGVVRAIQVLPFAPGEQAVALPLPKDGAEGRYRVVAMVQSDDTGRIHGAAMRAVPDMASAR